MSAQVHHEPATLFNVNQMVPFYQLESLQNRITTLEAELEKAIHHSKKKEAYANTLESDLEHIILQLKRLEVVR